MEIRIAVLAGVAALVSASCAPALRASPLVERDRVRPRPRALPRGARADFAPARFEKMFAAAVDLLRERGLDIAACEAKRGALTTVPVEFDAPCGLSTCLARETTGVKLGYRRARVTLKREVWDTALRAWREQVDPSTMEEISREERYIISLLVAGDPAAHDAGTGGHDPCVRSPCVGGNCVAASAATLR